MRIIFLGIDGVLNSARSCFTKLGPQLHVDLADIEDRLGDELGYGPRYSISAVDAQCVALLNLLVKETGAELVLSSSHRSYFTPREGHGSPEHLRLLNLYLSALGIEKPICSVTAKLYGQRGDEVNLWLASQDEPVDYVILDDSTDFLPGQNLVLTNPQHGLSFEDYVQACKFLGISKSGIIT